MRNRRGGVKERERDEGKLRRMKVGKRCERKGKGEVMKR